MSSDDRSQIQTGVYRGGIRMELDLGRLEDKGISTADGIGYTGGEEKYAAALQRYLKNYPENRKSVCELQKSKDTEAFMIKVHALKSNSKMIGAKDLASLFEKLELAAKEGDTAYIEENTDGVLKKYDELIEIIRPVGEMEEIHVQGELTAAEAKETADGLLEALDEFDDELSAELAKKLGGYPFRITQKQKLEEAARYIGDFLYDEAAELIKEIYPSIE